MLIRDISIAICWLDVNLPSLKGMTFLFTSQVQHWYTVLNSMGNPKLSAVLHNFHLQVTKVKNSWDEIWWKHLADFVFGWSCGQEKKASVRNKCRKWGRISLENQSTLSSIYSRGRLFLYPKTSCAVFRACLTFVQWVCGTSPCPQCLSGAVALNRPCRSLHSDCLHTHRTDPSSPRRSSQ